MVIVDDEPALLFLMRTVLENAGYQVVEAPNGELALERIADALPQVVVTDRMMPVMDGSTLVARLRANPRTTSVPIIMVSANPDTTANVDAFVNKPFKAADLIRAVERLISGAHANKGSTS